MDDTDNPPKFTVQQIILLQKLVHSGLTKDQIIAGVEEMEKLGCASGSGKLEQSTFLNGQNVGVKDQDKQGAENSRCQSPYPVQSNTSFSSHLSQGSSLVYPPSMRNTHHLPSLLPQAWPNTSPAVALLQNGFGSTSQSAAYSNLIAARGFLRRGSDGGAACIATNPANGITLDRESEQQQIQADINEELEELFRQDPAVIKEEIRKFISERHISQSAIAKATRNAISQSYISQWLAQPQDISGQKKRTMYTWYITEKRRYAAGIGGQLSGVQQLFSRSGTDVDLEHSSLLKSKRGSRFTWPKECVAVLEGFYTSNNYPDESKREEIAQSCNVIIQSHKPGLVMSETEKVTAGKVYNWFANRRKDDKRRRTIEQADAMDHNLTSPSPRRQCTSPSYSVHSNESATPGSSDQTAQSFAYEMAQVNNSILALVNPHNDSINTDTEDCERRLVGKLNDLTGKDLTTSSAASASSTPATGIKHEITDSTVSQIYSSWRPQTSSVSADSYNPSSPHQISSSSS